ncbi:PIG-L family deacetylase [Gammaproteobacteria bacterium]|nr:PIG-L family deacetylase [Gammaproteobacteria bacterium]MDC3279524.1 PIG-L family deacetylase [Gammaproteobacteria bacterium]
MTDDRVLVVVAHPDDEVLGCGGTMARLASDGVSVVVAILGEGLTSRTARRNDGTVLSGQIDKLRDNAFQANAMLGINDVQLFGLPDNRFDSVDLLDVIKIMERLVADFAPTMIFTHGGYDLNVDHGIVHRAVMTATRPVEGCGVREILAFEVPSSTEWAFGQLGNGTFRPQKYYDVTTTIDQKVSAMDHYESERRESPHPRASESLRALARWRGSNVGVAYAEAFEVIRSIQ